MSVKYKFTPAQRYAVLKVFEHKCRWCNGLLDNFDFHIDHVIPESLAKDPKELSKILESY